jgi:glycosyltransferase involved in cell wall biosynthesis
MKILWFAINASCYLEKLGGYNGGGWIPALEKIMKKQSDIQLGIAFEYNSEKFKDYIDGVVYYPINVCLTPYQKRIQKKTAKNIERLIIPECIKIIEDFKPDLIQCFGSEWCFGLVALYTKVPVIIHMQGSMPSYCNALYPPRYSKYSKMLYDVMHFHFKSAFWNLFTEEKYREEAEREIRIIKANRYFFGRTEWDFSLTKLFSPNRVYFKCWEALRDPFVNSIDRWKLKNRKKIILLTVGNDSLWKGRDVILKTARILSSYTDFQFCWKVIGNFHDMGYIEWMEGLKFCDYNVDFLGVLGEEELKKELLNCDLYIHPAYIDNSPNALCEAMILGVPSIASYVGGIPSLIQDGENGILVPVNEPYFLASQIIKLSNDKTLQEKISDKSVKVACYRHSIENIAEKVLSTYNEIIFGKENC